MLIILTTFTDSIFGGKKDVQRMRYDNTVSFNMFLKQFLENNYRFQGKYLNSETSEIILIVGC